MKEIVEIKFCVWCISISLIQGKRRQVCNKGIFKCVVAECMRTWKAWVFLIGKGFTDLISCYIKSFKCRAWTKCSKSYIYRLLIKLLTLFHHLRLKRCVEKVVQMSKGTSARYCARKIAVFFCWRKLYWCTKDSRSQEKGIDIFLPCFSGHRHIHSFVSKGVGGDLGGAAWNN